MNRRTDAARIEITPNDSDIVECRLARAISLLPFVVLFIGTLLWANAPVTTSKDWPLGLDRSEERSTAALLHTR